jgi:eukaryotic-like serine/threonine-protein kinase
VDRRQFQARNPPIHRPHQANWKFWGLGALAAVLAFALLFVLFTTTRKSPNDSAPLAVSLLPPPRNAYDLGIALSPDGSKLAFAAQSTTGNRRLWVRHLSSVSAQQLDGTDDGMLPFWSPDGQWIGFFASGKLKKIPANGGTVQDICDVLMPRGGTWNAQGTILFATPTSPLLKVNAAGGNPVPVTTLEPSTREQTHRWPDFLPDGIHFLYVARQTSEKSPAGVYVGSLDDNKFRKKLLDGSDNAIYAEPGYLVFVHKTTLMVEKFDPTSLSISGQPVPLTNDVERDLAVLWDSVSASQNGQIAYRSLAHNPDVNLAIVDRSGKAVSTLPLQAPAFDVRLSPDAHKVAVSVLDPAGEASGLWIYNLQNNIQSRFASADDFYLMPVWSPDGKQLAYGSSKTGPFNFYVRPSNGAGEEEPLHPSVEDERPESWSPDGKFLVYDERREKIMILPLAHNARPYSFLSVPYANTSGEFSPDGRWIAFLSSQSGRPEIYVTSFPRPKGMWQVSTTGARTPRWQKDGRALYYVDPEGAILCTEVNLSTDSLSVGNTVTVTNRRIVRRYNALYDVFPDGQHFVISTVPDEILHGPVTLLNNWPALLKK